MGVSLSCIPLRGIEIAVLSREEPAMTNHEYVVTGMTCGHCEHAVRDEVSRIPGVSAVEVSAATPMVAALAAEGPDLQLWDFASAIGHWQAKQ